jgi:hypothetical protein
MDVVVAEKQGAGAVGTVVVWPIQDRVPADRCERTHTHTHTHVCAAHNAHNTSGPP